MPARFRVDETFAITSRSLFVLVGEIVEGTVQVGMLVHVPFNDAVSMTAPLHGVEFVDGPGQKSRIGLTIDYEDDIGLALWQGMNLGDGEVLVIADAEDAPSSTTEPAPPPSRKKPRWKLW